MKLIECVPNFSEGRRPEVVAAIRDAIGAVDGVTILDVSSDASHNRTVITYVAPHTAVVDAAFAGVRTACDRIDLTQHSGEHPRIGATDVVPFVPLDGATMEDCVALARALGERVGRELRIPVYLYERAATRPDRENLAASYAASSRGCARSSAATPPAIPTSARARSTRPRARSPSARARSSSRTTSTSGPPRISPRPRRSRRPCAAPPAGSATSRHSVWRSTGRRRCR
jgi:hypothetical protein